jgi:very-short-patch-repair endonuclease
MTEKIKENVFEFLNFASDDYARIQNDYFSQEMYMNIIDMEITSPIEQIFYIACHVLCAAAHTQINPEPWRDSKGNDQAGIGIYMSPQVKIGKYKVDFLFSFNNQGPKEFYPDLIVELDGHDFHDKDKNQRAYEKARDRYLVKNGYKVLHFTGSEVVKEPYKVAHEALEMIGAFIGSGVSEEYDPSNIFGID